MKKTRKNVHATELKAVGAAIAHTHTRLTAPFLGLPRWAVTRKVKPIWILLNSGLSLASVVSVCALQEVPPQGYIILRIPLSVL